MAANVKRAIRAVIGGVFLSALTALHAETLLLKSGGRVDGQIEQSPAAGATGADAVYRVRSDAGILVLVPVSEVGRVIGTTAEEAEYERLLTQMPDTLEGHEELAGWCHERGLKDARDFHWRQVLERQPDHAQARQILGYSRIGGRWVRAEEFMQAQGYVRYKGSWRLPQQVAALQQQEEMEAAEKGWRRNIELWRSWLGGRRHDEGIQRLQAINDPLASAGLAQLLTEESDVEIRELYVDLLARLATPLAAGAMIDCAIHDSDLEVRLRSVDHLREMASDRAALNWIGALRSRDNRIVNRAGTALGRLGNRVAIRPLIDALVTAHETVVSTPSVQSGFGSAADGSGGFNGLSVGGGPKRIRRELQNKNVLEALVAITGQNHRYSLSDWNNWYIRQRQLPADVNLRRDVSAPAEEKGDGLN
jgi:hypothetical protein